MAEKKPGIDQALIRDLANILNDTDLTEIEVEQDDLRIRVSRNGTPVASPCRRCPPTRCRPPSPPASRLVRPRVPPKAVTMPRTQ